MLKDGLTEFELITYSLLDYLKENAKGEHKAITTKQLLYSFSFKDAGALRRSIHHLRLQGEPICSSPKGYFYSNNPAEVRKTIDNLFTRIRGTFDLIDGLEIALKNVEGK